MSRLLVLQQSKSFRFFVCVLAALTIGAFFADTAAAPSEAIAAEANAAAGDAAPAGEGEIQVEPPPTVEQLENHWHTNGEQGSLYIAHLLSTAFSAYVIPEWLLTLGGLLITVGMVFGFINLFALGAVWSERKVSAHMQCRLGPMEVGPHGLLQTIADGIKLTTKEDIIPKLADRPLFIIAPIIVFTGVLIRFVPLPFGDKLIASDMDLGLFFIAAVGAVEVLGVIMAGWSSNNKWSLFATIRTATQMVSYEIPIGIAFITVIVSCGSFSLVEIVNQQGGYQTTVEGIQETGWIWHWNLFRNPFILVLSITYFIASLAECKRAPFDLPEAESELVSGFHTEYSGIRFALFFLAEYAAMYLVAAIGVVIFFGGWWTGIFWIDQIGLAGDSTTAMKGLGMLIKVGVFLSKAFALVFVQMWIRWTLPRVRLDQMMYLCWKVLMPISIACLIGSVVWELMSQGSTFFGFGIAVETGR